MSEARQEREWGRVVVEELRAALGRLVRVCRVYGAARKHEYYVVMPDPQIIRDDDGTVVVAVDAFHDDAEEPVKLCLNIGDDLEAIEKIAARIVEEARRILRG